MAVALAPLSLWAGGQLWQWLSRRLVCGPLVPLLGAGGWRISLRAGHAALLRMWEVTLLPRGADQLSALCSVVVVIRATLRASLSGTLLQTLPDLVTPLKGRSLSPRSCPVTRSAPSERFGY